MKNKMTQREIVARYLAARPKQWIAGYELVKSASSVIGKDYIIQDADTRAYDLVRDGFDSNFNTYTFATQRIGKYAFFQCTSKTRRERVHGLKDFTFSA